MLVSLASVLLLASVAVAVPSPTNEDLTNAERFSRGLGPASPKGFEKRNGRSLPATAARMKKRQSLPSGVAATPGPSPTTVSFRGKNYVNKGLQAVGVIPATARDETGTSIGGLGSAIEFQPGSWSRDAATGVYSGVLIAQPDRGHNGGGGATVDYQARQLKFGISMRPYTAGNNLVFSEAIKSCNLTYQSTLLYSDQNGIATSGLDPQAVRAPSLPQARANYDRLSFDSEGLVINADGSFYVSDEYGPGIYHMSAGGTLLNNILAPPAFQPRDASGNLNFTASIQPATGRTANQGYESLTRSPDGTKLYAMTQSSLIQDSATVEGPYARMVTYDISGATPNLIESFVIQLPVRQSNGATYKTSEFRYLDDTTFLMLPRDGRGQGDNNANSLFKEFRLMSTAGATNIANTQYTSTTTPVISNGAPVSGVTAATTTTFISLIDGPSLARLGMRNAAPFGAGLIVSKFESITFAPALDGTGDYFLFSLADNDFITTNGNDGQMNYSDSYGMDVDTQLMVWRISLPSAPLVIA